MPDKNFHPIFLFIQQLKLATTINLRQKVSWCIFVLVVGLMVILLKGVYCRLLKQIVYFL